ncbi:MAG: hypothetical protein H7Y15_08535 [Pseudonocardia sp.]|nr:hypothetical protein [Pseudonocardia sp.]
MIISLIVGGVGLIALVAVIVGIVDARQAPTWRHVAAERRDRWEGRQPEFHGAYYDSDDD